MRYIVAGDPRKFRSYHGASRYQVSGREVSRVYIDYVDYAHDSTVWLYQFSDSDDMYLCEVKEYFASDQESQTTIIQGPFPDLDSALTIMALLGTMIHQNP